MDDKSTKYVDAVPDWAQIAPLVLDGLPTSICVLDERGMVLAANEKWRASSENGSKLNRHATPGADYVSICEAAHSQEPMLGDLAVGLRAVLFGDLKDFSLEYSGKPPFTEHRYNVKVIRLSDQKPLRVIIAEDDVTTLKESEEALREAHRRKDEFLAMLGHELRNPLAAISNALMLLQMWQVSPEDSQQAVKIMDRQLQKMTRLLNDLLEASRVTQGRINLQKQLVDARDVAERALAAHRPFIDAQSLTVSLTVPKQDVPVLADPTRLEQMLGNLLHNAAKYTLAGGHIWVSVALDQDDVLFKVRDDGIGMTPHTLEHAFELFAQAERPLDRSQGGLGVGLSIVRSLAELHGGSVTGRSEGLGQGSEFSMRLPSPVVSDEQRNVLDDSPFSSRVDNRTVRRILVVEDNQDSADTLSMLLEHWGFTVRTVYDGLSAVQEASSYHPEIVLLDIGLPGMDGYEVARELRAREGEHVKLLALTGYGRDEDRARSRAAGIDHHLTKPVRAQTLQSLLAS